MIDYLAHIDLRMLPILTGLWITTGENCEQHQTEGSL